MVKNYRNITASVLAEVFDYDANTGALRWRHRPASHFANLHGQRIFNAQHAGRVASWTSSNGYLNCRFKFAGREFTVGVHRIAFCLQTGRWPTDEVDHIDGNKANNVWANLREATRQQNARNSSLRDDNEVGLKWVKKEKRTGRFVARATVGGEHVHFGTFDTPDEAHQRAKQSLSGVYREFCNGGTR
jgi:hypothetical protein